MARRVSILIAIVVAALGAITIPTAAHASMGYDSCVEGMGYDC